MNKVIFAFLASFMSANVIAGTYDQQIEQAQKECDQERSMSQSDFHSNGNACQRAQQLIELQKSENEQNQNVNVHLDDNR